MKTLRLPCLSGLLILLVFTLTGRARAQIGPGALADAIDQNSLTVTAGSGWTRVTGAAAHDGVDAAQVTLTSGAKSMELTITGPARVTWWWRKSLSGGTLRAEGIYGAMLAATRAQVTRELVQLSGERWHGWNLQLTSEDIARIRKDIESARRRGRTGN